MIHLDNVSITRDGTAILEDVTLTIEPSESLCILGQNGSGKSSLLRLLLAEEDPTQGAVLVDNVDLFSLPAALFNVYKQSIGMVFPSPLLLRDRTAHDNVVYALEAQGKERQEANERASALLHAFDLEKKANNYPAGLTRTEEQKVALARAIANDPKILIADDPFRDLDSAGVEEILALLQEIDRNGVSVIVGLREPDIAAQTGFRIVRMEFGQIVS